MKVRAHSILALLLVFASGPAFSAPKWWPFKDAQPESSLSTCERMLTVFSAVYDSDQHYVCKSCDRNTVRLIHEAKDRGIPLEAAHLVIFVPIADDMFSVENSRTGAKSWSYHVVLEVDGQVFDFDYFNGPKMIGVSEYVRTMFGAEALDEVAVSIYSAKEFEEKEGLREIGFEVIRAYSERGQDPATLRDFVRLFP